MLARISKYAGWPLAGLCGYGALYFAAQRAVYHPLKFPDGYWELRSRSNAEDVWLRAADGVRLHGWWAPRSGAHLATLFLHGNGGNLTHRIDHIREITEAGSALLLVDYRGYGKSEGRPTERGLYADADAGYDYLVKSGYAANRILIHGESLGSAVAVDLAARRPCAGLVLEAPFPSAGDVAGLLLPVIGPTLIRSFNSKHKIGSVRAPMLFLHGDRDDVIPIELGRALFEAAPRPKTFWPIAGAGHNDIVEVGGLAYRDHLRSFYDSLK